MKHTEKYKNAHIYRVRSFSEVCQDVLSFLFRAPKRDTKKHRSQPPPLVVFARTSKYSGGFVFGLSFKTSARKGREIRMRGGGGVNASAHARLRHISFRLSFSSSNTDAKFSLNFDDSRGRESFVYRGDIPNCRHEPHPSCEKIRQIAPPDTCRVLTQGCFRFPA